MSYRFDRAVNLPGLCVALWVQAIWALWAANAQPDQQISVKLSNEQLIRFVGM